MQIPLFQCPLLEISEDVPGMKTGTRVHSDVPPEREPERGYVHMFPRNENRNEGTFAKPPFYETVLLSPSECLNHFVPIHVCSTEGFGCVLEDLHRF